MISDSKKALKQVFYIYYLVLFNGSKIKILLNLDNEVNAINLAFIDKLGFFV